MDFKLWISLSLLAVVFVVGERDVNVVLNGDAVLPCRSNVTKYTTVIWLAPNDETITINDNVVASEAGRYDVDTRYQHEWNLHIFNVRLTDDGIYSCAIDSDPMQMHLVNLHVLVPPTIGNKSAAMVSVPSGGDVTMSCEASGNPQPSVTWYYYEANGDKTELLVGSSQYHIHNATKHQAGSYECAADNGIPPPAKAEFKLDVTFAPVLILPHPQLSLSTGKDTLLDCIVTGYPAPTISWSKDGAPVQEGSRHVIREWQVDAHTSRLDVFITDLHEEDFGEYTCSANNSHGENSASMHLYELVSGSVRVTSAPRDAVTRMRNTARFNCTVEGMTSRHTLTWWHSSHVTGVTTKLFDSNVGVIPPSAHDLAWHGAASSSHNNARNESDRNVDGASSHNAELSSLSGQGPAALLAMRVDVEGLYNLIVRDVRLEDGGQFMCQLDALQNYTAELTVADTLTCGQNATEVHMGEVMNLTCSMHYSGAYTAWDVTWSHGSDKLSALDYDQPGWLHRVVSRRTWPTDAGEYTCTVTGPEGFLSQACSSDLTVIEEEAGATSAPVIEPTTPALVEAGLPVLAVGMGLALLVTVFVFLLIIGGLVSRHRAEIRRLQSRLRELGNPVEVRMGPISGRYKNGSAGSGEASQPLTQAVESNHQETQPV